MDAKTKLVASYLVGKRTGENAVQLMRDLQFRVKNRIQITTDGFRPYIEAVEKSFGRNVDFAQLVKVYSGDEKTRARYSPSEIVSAYPATIMGKPKQSRISTSYIERQKLNHEDANAQVYATNQRVFQEADQYKGGSFIAFCALQFHARTFVTSCDTCNASRINRSRVELGRIIERGKLGHYQKLHNRESGGERIVAAAFAMPSFATILGHN